MNWLLIAVLVLVIVMAVVGLHRGFIRSVYPFVAMSVTIVLLYFLAPHLRDLLMKHTEIDERIETRIFTALGEELPLVSSKPLPEQIQNLSLPKPILETLTEAVEENAGAALDTVLHAVSQRLTRTVITAMVYVGGFIIIYILLLLLGRLLRLATKLPVLKQADKILGLVLGLLMAVLVVDLFFIFLTGFAQFSFGRKMISMIAESEILSFLYEMNFLTRIF